MNPSCNGPEPPIADELHVQHPGQACKVLCLMRRLLPFQTYVRCPDLVDHLRSGCVLLQHAMHTGGHVLVHSTPLLAVGYETQQPLKILTAEMLHEIRT